MRKDFLYTQFGRYIEDLSDEQVKRINLPAAQELLHKKISKTYLNNMKRAVLEDRSNIRTSAKCRLVLDKIKAKLDEVFPRWSEEHGEEEGKTYIKIWLEGKP